MTTNIDRQDLAACERQPIHRLNAVQAHGCLIAFGREDRVIRHVSENIAALVPGPAASWVGRKLTQLLGKESAEALSAAIDWPRIPPASIPRRELKLTVGDKPCDAYLVGTEPSLTLELTPVTANAPAATGMSSLHACLDGLAGCDTVSEACDLDCRVFRRATGMDRVMVYRFMEETWHGEVVAEDKTAAAHSFLAHRFPAGDIPKPARDLYLLNRTRFIRDSQAANAGILPGSSARMPDVASLDLTHARLRAVPEVHLEYLRNMGVRCSFSAAIVVRGRLWGLIACHHFEVMDMPPEIRGLCEAIAAALALQVRFLEETRACLEVNAFNSKIMHSFKRLNEAKDPWDHLFRERDLVLSAFQSHGMAVAGARRADMIGFTPPESAVMELAAEMRKRMKDLGRAVISAADLPEWGDDWRNLGSICGGVLAAVSQVQGGDMLLLFRPEEIRTIVWGGDPAEILAKRGYGGRINPRQSFASWRETVRGRSKPWTPLEEEGILFLMETLFRGGISKTMLARELQGSLT